MQLEGRTNIQRPLTIARQSWIERYICVLKSVPGSLFLVPCFLRAWRYISKACSSKFKGGLRPACSMFKVFRVNWVWSWQLGLPSEFGATPAQTIIIPVIIQDWKEDSWFLVSGSLWTPSRTSAHNFRKPKHVQSIQIKHKALSSGV